ncbi:hsp70 [Ecytonucleospora hepatopenaei]|uniref:Hsp70 n=1 Tax=Ecytonucleospora hepatopenaei TaxID=646526 RepID=A0A1W0E3R3_9MICR|nr:hsp70 [Ecytonucleospora hepatopenaei]
MFKLWNFLLQTNATSAQKPKVYVGIDLGTTFSCVGIFHQDRSFEYLNFGGETPDTIPSVVYVDKFKTGESPLISVGYEAQAKNKASQTSDNFFYGFKRLMGLLANHKEVAGFKKSVTYDVERKIVDNKVAINVFPVILNDKSKIEFSPTDLSAFLLSKIHQLITSKYEILSVVITTPSYFSVEQEEETRKAGQMAGFEKIKIAKEPTAACIEYAQTADLKVDKEESTLVFDLGGGTFDISIVEVENDMDDGQKNSTLTVAKYCGDNFLGGENVNDYLFDHFKTLIPHTLSQDEALTLRLIIEKFKINSCTRWKTDPNAVMKDVFFDANKQRYELSLTQAEFNKLSQPVYDKIDHLLFNKEIGLFRPMNTNKNQLDKPVDISTIKKIVLVGGSTRIPYIKEYLKNKFKNVPIYDSIDPDKSVAAGAARLCMNSDSASGDSSLTMLDITTLPIGICVSDGSFKPILEKDLVIPIEQHEVFTTVRDNQSAITVEVASGMRQMFKDNHPIGKFDFQLDELQPRGVPQIQVSCKMDANYKLTVTAMDLKTKKKFEKVFKTDYISGNKDFINKMLEDAKKHKAEDEELGALLTQKRLYTQGLEEYEKQLTNAKNLSEDKKLHFETVLQTLKEWYSANENSVKSDEMERQVARLGESAQELAQAISASGEKKEEEPKKEDVL